MSSATMTLIGMYNWDNTLFDNLQVPDGVDKATLIDNILIRSGEFEVMYSDFDFMKFSIGAWSRKWYPTLERWVDALSIEYNPLENYDRQEDWTDYRDIKGSEKGKNTGSIGRNENGSDSLGRGENGSSTMNRTESGNESGTEHRNENSSTNGSESRTENSTNSGSTTGTSGSTTTTNVSAYDGGSTYTPKEQLIVSASDGTTSSGAVSLAISGLNANTVSLTVSGITGKLNSLTVSQGDIHSLTVSQSNIHSLTVSEAQLHSFTVSRMTDDDLTHSGRVHGNIGVTTSQQMLLSELQLGYWNIYEKITDIFLTEFVIPVY